MLIAARPGNPFPSNGSLKARPEETDKSILQDKGRAVGAPQPFSAAAAANVCVCLNKIKSRKFLAREREKRTARPNESAAGAHWKRPAPGERPTSSGQWSSLRNVAARQEFVNLCFR